MESQFTNQENSTQEYAYSYYSAPDLTVEDIPNPENRKYGLSRAIAAMILSMVSIFIGIIAMYAVVFSLVGFGNEVEELGVPTLLFGFFATVGGVVTAIIAIVLGVKSIICFKKKTPRPIATLVLGIASVYNAVSGVVLALYDIFFIFIALIAAATI